MNQIEYRDAFASLGRKLTGADAIPERDITAADRRLGCTAPEALRSFYLVAGGARDFIDRYDHFLLPADWSREGTKLVFLEENQSVVLYAVDTVDSSPDPPVVMADNTRPYEWVPVCGTCSKFLQVMLHWEASFGGVLPAGGSAVVPEGVRHELAARLQPIGEVNEMWAYGGNGLAVCLVEWTDGWRVFAGAVDDGALEPLRSIGGVDPRAWNERHV